MIAWPIPMLFTETDVTDNGNFKGDFKSPKLFSTTCQKAEDRFEMVI
jgi:hypothetical protein